MIRESSGSHEPAPAPETTDASHAPNAPNVAGAPEPSVALDLAKPRGPAGPAPRGLVPPRPMVERLGMAVIAAVVGSLFGLMAAASWVSGEGFLALMAGMGAVMTLWAGISTLRRG